MRERVKRVDSIILKRFLLYNSVESVREKIVEVCSFLGVHGVVLEGLQKIGSTDLFRTVDNGPWSEKGAIAQVSSVKAQSKFLAHLYS